VHVEGLPRHRISVLAKEGCHLCENAIDTLKQLASPSFDLEVIDITKNRILFERYFLKIPVVQLDGKDVFVVDEIALPEDCRKKLSTLVARLK
jgi:glutaredoxin